MEPVSTVEPPTYVRVTLRWVAIGVVLLFGIGVIGGVAGQRLATPPLPPLSSNDRLVTTVQEVTISPNTAVAQVVEQANRSVMLLGTRAGTSIQPRATAVVVTNDGLLASTAQLPDGDIFALDETGSAVALDRVGVDALYGISYWRIPTSVVVPLDLRRETVNVGSELTGISRSDVTRQTKVMPYRLTEFRLPRESDSAGWQRLWQGAGEIPTLFIGAPLLDYEGHLAGLVLDTEGRAVGMDILELSLRRVAAGQREFDPFERVGVMIDFSFVAPDGQAIVFTPRITAVAATSSATRAGVQRGDAITTINDEPVTWETVIAQQLSATLPLTVTLQRGGESVLVTLSEAPAS